MYPESGADSLVAAPSATAVLAGGPLTLASLAPRLGLTSAAVTTFARPLIDTRQEWARGPAAVSVQSLVVP
ncbi:hypothetical protein U2F26_24960 [Micromonospora sp. 4G57]|uniref:Uncharacterized protein n=1 Tax=Micromonospora sicca TaxID=2202420 RepID=A0ABU5JJF0_9ACTN|nr:MULTISPECIES: hypothetical protein [unclassified Micromonospora]MDZ5445942.1 hypothetical protein [Micromonospora sp. 4G57]MDZ5492728.1 hypothetical protein [Micromonospora sp. 4G53]